jgi:Gpi18-like mannosyltransferase
MNNFNKLIEKYWKQQSLIYGLFGVLIILALVLRYSLSDYQGTDYTMYVSQWYEVLKVHGLHEFKYNFSNYNAPYLYLLFIVTKLPISEVHAIKGVSILFDLVLAYGVYLVVGLFRPGKYTALIAGSLVLFLPTVFINSAYWGQVDGLYTSFLMFSLYFLLRNDSRWAWIMWGISLAFKLQAIFFLPVLIIMMFKRVRWYDAGWAILVFLVLSLGPALAGRPISSILDTYISQSQTYNLLTLNAPNWYQWISSQAFQYFNGSGVYMTAAAVIFIALISLIHKKYSDRETLFLACLMLFVVPFLLPQMHERYFYPAEIASLVLAFTYPISWFMAVMMQVITIMAYSPFLFGRVVIPLSTLAIFVLFIIFVLFVMYLNDGLPVKEWAKRLSLRASNLK